MKIEFEKDIVGFQEARKLKMILEHYAHSDATDKSTLLLIESVLEQIQGFISDPKFETLAKDTSIDDEAYRLVEDSQTIFSRLIASLRAVIGPTRKEMLLSKQRQELLERAERAESMAFDALAETVEIARERDALQNKLKQSQENAPD
jgi:hypothetical protein